MAEFVTSTPGWLLRRWVCLFSAGVVTSAPGLSLRRRVLSLQRRVCHNCHTNINVNTKKYRVCHVGTGLFTLAPVLSLRRHASSLRPHTSTNTNDKATIHILIIVLILVQVLIRIRAIISILMLRKTGFVTSAPPLSVRRRVCHFGAGFRHSGPTLTLTLKLIYIDKNTHTKNSGTNPILMVI